MEELNPKPCAQGPGLFVSCVHTHLQVVSILQQEALWFQPDPFALFSGDAVNALVVVVVVGGKVGRQENPFWSNRGGSALGYIKRGKGRNKRGKHESTVYSTFSKNTTHQCF